VRSMEDEIKKFALHNAYEHDGKADVNSVLGKLLSKDPSLKGKVKEIIPLVKKIVDEVNALDKNTQKEMLEKIVPELLVTKKVEEVHRLPDLPDVTGPVVMRLAPSPSGPLHIGHSRMAILNDEYVKRYGGKLILRIEDTNPYNIEKSAYDMIREDLEWLDVKIHEIVIQSDRFHVYYDYAKKLIEMGKAYITLCNEKDWRKLKAEKKPCPDRDLDPSIHLERWEKMLSNAYRDHEAVYVVKTDLNHPNPAVRDWAAFRIISKARHPRTGEKYVVYPLMNFSVAIDDHDYSLTHVLRGKDHLNNTLRQIYIFDYFNWKKPVYIHYGKVRIEGLILKTSIIKKGIRDGSFTGWDDVRLGTLLALRKRGIDPEAIRKYWVDAGLKEVDIVFSWENLYAYNRTIVEPRAKRFFFVWDPVEVKAKINEKIESKAPYHPNNPSMGYRIYSFENDSNFYLTKDDWDNIKDGEIFRLKDLGNFRRNGNMIEYVNNDLSMIKKLKIIHWCPENSLNAEIIMPDGNVKKGLIEPLIKSIKNEVVQLERFGFVNIFVDENITGFFSHR